MTNTEARIKIKNKNFEILVDLNKALELKKGKNVLPQEFLAINMIFSDVKKGLKVSEKDLIEAFGTSDIFAVAERIVKNGEILLPIEYKKKEQENKRKQVIEFLVKNAIDPLTKRPHTPTRIEEALEKTGVNIDNRPVEEQIPRVLEELKKVLPIKIENKKLKITIPSVYTGKVYGLLQNYKEKEEWLSNGSLEVVVNLPSGMQIEFYDKINKIAHGAIQSEEIKN
ncbi:MAG: ribosome assembly factor SBDS [Candidatus Pacearchaeota archaeon]